MATFTNPYHLIITPPEEEFHLMHANKTIIHHFPKLPARVIDHKPTYVLLALATLILVVLCAARIICGIRNGYEYISDYENKNRDLECGMNERAPLLGGGRRSGVKGKKGRKGKGKGKKVSVREGANFREVGRYCTIVEEEEEEEEEGN